MALLNRDKDTSEQRNLYSWSSNAAIATGQTIPIAIAQTSEQILGIQAIAWGVSGSPVLTFQIGRFIVGTGFTMLSTGFTALTMPAFGTSGLPLGTTPITQLTAGSTLNQMGKNDFIIMSTSGSNAAASYTVEVVTQTLQDIKQTYGF